MENETNKDMKLPSLDDLCTTQEERDDAKLKRIHEIPIREIDPFPDHPFKVRDDEDMENLVDSIKAKGVITPCMVRKTPDGRYEMISGHRRMRASGRKPCATRILSSSWCRSGASARRRRRRRSATTPRSAKPSRTSTSIWEKSSW